MFHSHQIPIVKSTSRIPVYIETWDIVMKPHFPRTLACYACASLLYNKILYFSPEGTSLMTTRPEWSRKHDGCETLQQSLFISAVSTSRAGQLRRGSGVEPLCETEPKTQACNNQHHKIITMGALTRGVRKCQTVSPIGFRTSCALHATLYTLSSWSSKRLTCLHGSGDVGEILGRGTP